MRSLLHGHHAPDPPSPGLVIGDKVGDRLGSMWAVTRCECGAPRVRADFDRRHPRNPNTQICPKTEAWAWLCAV